MESDRVQGVMTGAAADQDDTGTAVGAGAGSASQPRAVLRQTILAAAAAALCLWGLPHESVQPYYAGAVRSMAVSWHAFLFGAVDTAGTVSLDKLPGAFWVQALSVRMFGVHTWALVLPQVVEGVATVVVLYRVVDRWLGPVAATVAGAVMASTPVVVVVNRDDLSDTLLVLLLVLAAGALQKSLDSDRIAPLLRCGLWVGLAFQVKMAQAWAVLPVFALVYGVTARHRISRRVRDVTGMTVVAVATSLSWLAFVWAVPPGQRPYVDATIDDDPFTLAFGYNLSGRFGHASAGEAAIVAAGTPANDLGWHTLIEPVYFAPQFSWLAPTALIALAVGLAGRRGQPRTDPVRTGYLLWGGWLVIHAAAFSTASAFHGYYTIVLAPAVAALAGAAAVRLRVLPTGAGAAVAFGAAWAVYLDMRHPHFADWLAPTVAALGIAAAVAWSIPRLAGRTATILSAAALLVSPLVWSVTALNPVYAGTPFAPMAGPVGSNYQTVVLRHQPLPDLTLHAPTGDWATLLAFLRGHRGRAEYLLATQGEAPAEPFLLAGAQPLLVLGGFTGVTPFPTASSFASDVSDGEVRFALLSSAGLPTPTTRWIAAECRLLGQAVPAGTELYDCGGPSAITPAG